MSCLHGTSTGSMTMLRTCCGRAGMGYLGAAQAVSVSNGVQLCGLWFCMLVGKVGAARLTCICVMSAAPYYEAGVPRMGRQACVQ